MKKMLKDVLASILIGLLAIACHDTIFQIAGILFDRDGGNIVGVLLSAGSKALFVAVGVLGFIGLRILRRQKELKQLLLELKRQGETHSESQDACHDAPINND